MTHFMPVTPSAPAPASAPTPATALSLGLGQFPELGLPVSLPGCCWGAAGGVGSRWWDRRSAVIVPSKSAICLKTAACKQQLHTSAHSQCPVSCLPSAAGPVLPGVRPPPHPAARQCLAEQCCSKQHACPAGAAWALYLPQCWRLPPSHCRCSAHLVGRRCQPPNSTPDC